jgi:MT0933-like antitoxin protein
MGFLDKAKTSLIKAVDQHGDKIEKGADQLGRAINSRTGNKHADKIAKGRAQLRKGLDGLDGRNDDFRGR